MLIRIDRKEREIFEKNCAGFSLQSTFFTCEANPNMLQVEILDQGKEITLNDAFNVGRLTGMEKLYLNAFK